MERSKDPKRSPLSALLGISRDAINDSKITESVTFVVPRVVIEDTAPSLTGISFLYTGSTD
jgi:hypothetical protein